MPPTWLATPWARCMPPSPPQVRPRQQRLCRPRRPPPPGPFPAWCRNSSATNNHVKHGFPQPSRPAPCRPFSFPRRPDPGPGTGPPVRPWPPSPPTCRDPGPSSSSAPTRGSGHRRHSTGDHSRFLAGFPPSTACPAGAGLAVAETSASTWTTPGPRAHLDPGRSLDHGARTPLCLMYPGAAFPVVPSCRSRRGAAPPISPWALSATPGAAAGWASRPQLRAHPQPGRFPQAASRRRRHRPTSAKVRRGGSGRLEAGDEAALLDYRRQAPAAVWCPPQRGTPAPRFFVALGAGGLPAASAATTASTPRSLAMDSYAFWPAPLKETPCPRPHFTAIALHWLMAVLLVGLFGGHLHARPAPVALEAAVYSWHKWAGVTAFLLLILRLAWRAGRPSPLPPPCRTGQHAGRHGTACTTCSTPDAGVPISGWLMSSAKGFQTVWFGVLPCPRPGGPGDKPGRHPKGSPRDSTSPCAPGHRPRRLPVKHHLVDRDDVLPACCPSSPKPDKRLTRLVSPPTKLRPVGLPARPGH